MARPSIDFGQAADDYARHRPGFPVAFYERAGTYGVGVAGQSILDLGCGTGTLARGFAQRGCRSTGLDPSPPMLLQGQALARQENVEVGYVCAWAEQTPFGDRCFDTVCAGQCWHWFDRPRVAAEAQRLLRAGGTLVVAYFTYLSDAGTLGHATEQLLLSYNPNWPAAGGDGRFPMFAEDLPACGFASVESFEFEIDIAMSHAAWLGRMRACNGVILMAAEQAAEFDAALAALLEANHPLTLQVPHRIYTIVARRA